MTQSDRLMNVKEVAAFLHVAEVTVRRMTERGDLPCYRVGNRNERRFRPRDIEVYLASRRQTPSVSKRGRQRGRARHER
jgi:excisionase family DNA binding protein